MILGLPNAFYGGVMGVVMLLVIFAITIIIFLICRQKKIKRYFFLHCIMPDNLVVEIQ